MALRGAPFGATRSARRSRPVNRAHRTAVHHVQRAGRDGASAQPAGVVPQFLTLKLHPLLNDDRQAATFAEWYLDRLTHEESLTTPEQRRAAFRNWHAGVGRPIWRLHPHDTKAGR